MGIRSQAVSQAADPRQPKGHEHVHAFSHAIAGTDTELPRATREFACRPQSSYRVNSMRKLELESGAPILRRWVKQRGVSLGLVIDISGLVCAIAEECRRVRSICDVGRRCSRICLTNTAREAEFEDDKG